MVKGYNGEQANNKQATEKKVFPITIQGYILQRTCDRNSFVKNPVGQRGFLYDIDVSRRRLNGCSPKDQTNSLNSLVYYRLS